MAAASKAATAGALTPTLLRRTLPISCLDPDLRDRRFVRRPPEDREVPVVAHRATEAVVAVAHRGDGAAPDAAAPERGEDAVVLPKVVLVVDEEEGRIAAGPIGRSEPSRRRQRVEQR